MSQQTAPRAEAQPRPTPTVFRRKRRLPFFLSFYTTAVGKKWVMALSGIALMGYVLAHMVGNLHLYEGPEEINAYAAALRDLGGDLTPTSAVLWVMRIGLAAAFLLHLHAAYSLTVMNHRARPVRYASKRDYLAANYASRTMRWSGILLFAFIGIHLSDLTWGWLNPDFIHGDVYNNVVTTLDRPLYAVIYLVAQMALFVHLLHGSWSIFQSLGLNSPRYNSWRRGFAATFAAVVVIGNLSFPLAVSWGLVNQDDRCWPTTQQIEDVEDELGVPPDQLEAVMVQVEAGTQGAFPPHEGGINCWYPMGDDLVPILNGEDPNPPAAAFEGETHLPEAATDSSTGTPGQGGGS